MNVRARVPRGDLIAAVAGIVLLVAFPGCVPVERDRSYRQCRHASATLEKQRRAALALENVLWHDGGAMGDPEIRVTLPPAPSDARCGDRRKDVGRVENISQQEKRK